MRQAARQSETPAGLGQTPDAADAFTAAGFQIAVISEPAPAPAARELFPGEIAASARVLGFLFFVLQAG